MEQEDEQTLETIKTEESEQAKETEKPETENAKTTPVSYDSENIFRCKSCNLHAKYNYYGVKPLERHDKVSATKETSTNVRKEDIQLLEKCFVCDDPFLESRSANFLILGSRCFNCKSMICVRSKCSVFYYTKRFCIKCAQDNLDSFPKEIQAELVKNINS